MANEPTISERMKLTAAALRGDDPTEVTQLFRQPTPEDELKEALQIISVWPIPVSFTDAKSAIVEIRSFARDTLSRHASD